MKRILAYVLFAAAPADGLALDPANPPKQADSVVKSLCGDCGVVTSVREIEKHDVPPAADSSKPSGLVATFPLGPSGGKPQVGSSTKLGADVVTVSKTYEVIVRRDDGRMQVFILDDAPELARDDKVRIVDGKPVRRGQ
jgi:hypothetical protein